MSLSFTHQRPRLPGMPPMPWRIARHCPRASAVILPRNNERGDIKAAVLTRGEMDALWTGPGRYLIHSSRFSVGPRSHPSWSERGQQDENGANLKVRSRLLRRRDLQARADRKSIWAESVTRVRNRPICKGRALWGFPGGSRSLRRMQRFLVSPEWLGGVRPHLSRDPH